MASSPQKNLQFISPSKEGGDFLQNQVKQGESMEKSKKGSGISPNHNDAPALLSFRPQRRGVEKSHAQMVHAAMGTGNFAVPLHYLHEPPASFRFYPPLEMAAVRNSICAISKVSGINKENRKAVKNVQSFFTAFLHHRFPSPAPAFTAFVPTAQCTKILRRPSE